MLWRSLSAKLRLEGVFVLPRAAMRDAERLLVLDQDDRLRFRRVELLRIEHDRVVIKSFALTEGSSLPQIVQADLSLATVEPGEPGGGGGPHQTLWGEWAATNSLPLRIAMTANGDCAMVSKKISAGSR